MTRSLAFGMLLGAILVPVSLLLGMSPLKSVAISVVMVVVFAVFSVAMSRLLKSRD